jgi:hypothetical protein
MVAIVQRQGVLQGHGVIDQGGSLQAVHGLTRMKSGGPPRDRPTLIITLQVRGDGKEPARARFASRIDPLMAH